MKAVLQAWFTRVLKAAEKDIATGTLTDTPALPEKATRQIWDTVREALAQGYWLQHIYLREVEAAAKGGTYRGRVTLSDTDPDVTLRDALESFISSRRVNVSSEWHSVIPQSAVDWLKGYTPTLMGVLEQDVLTAVRDVIRNSMLEGKTLSQRMDDLKAASPKIAAMIDRRVEMIARTEVTRADSMGRLMETKNNPDVVGFEFCAILDDRTTDICEQRHGLILARDSGADFIAAQTPPLHVNCRSTLIPLTAYEYPDGVSTSPEFNDVPESKQRESDIEIIRSLLAEETPEPVVEEPVISTSTGGSADWLKNLEAQLKSGAFWNQVPQTQAAAPTEGENTTEAPYLAPTKPSDTIRGVTKEQIDRLRGTRGHIDLEMDPDPVQIILEDYRRVGISLTRQEAEEIHDAVLKFTQGRNGAMRDAFTAQRDGGMREPDHDEMLTAYMRVAEYTRIAPTYESEGRELYRGIGVSDIQYHLRLSNLKPGDIFDLEMPSSFSSTAYRAAEFSRGEDGILIHIPATGLTNAVSVQHLSEAAIEDEVLVDDRKWVVTKVEDRQDGLHHIWLRRAGR